MKNLLLIITLMLVSPSLIKGDELELCKNQYSNSIDAFRSDYCKVTCIGKKGTKVGSSYLGTVNWNEGCGNRAHCFLGQCVSPEEFSGCLRSLPSVKIIWRKECSYKCISTDENGNWNGTFSLPNNENSTCGFENLWHCKNGNCVQ